MRKVLGVTLGLVLGACVAPVQPATRATDAARELNLAARFGRMDIAIGFTSNAARETFIERHSHWREGIRVVDVQLAGLQMYDKNRASIQVDYAWVRVDESTLRKTRVAQLWQDEAGAGWQLVREQQIAGDAGLFGEAARKPTTGRPDVHLPSRTLRATSDPTQK